MQFGYYHGCPPPPPWPPQPPPQQPPIRQSTFLAPPVAGWRENPNLGNLPVLPNSHDPLGSQARTELYSYPHPQEAPVEDRIAGSAHWPDNRPAKPAAAAASSNYPPVPLGGGYYYEMPLMHPAVHPLPAAGVHTPPLLSPCRVSDLLPEYPLLEPLL